jgi:hypothetical protein
LEECQETDIWNLEGCQETDICLRHCSGIRVEVARNTEANLNQESNCVNRNVITLSRYVQAGCEKLNSVQQQQHLPPVIHRCG